MKKENIIKLTIKYLLLVFLFIIFSFVYSNDEWNIKKAFGQPNEEVRIISTSGLEEKNGTFHTVDDDPWIILKCVPEYGLVINIAFDDIEFTNGHIYYAENSASFTEGKSFDYTFKNGNNYINIDDNSYIRLDIIEHGNLYFNISSIQQEAKGSYILKELNYFFIFLSAFLVLALYEVLKLINPIDNYKVRLVSDLLLIISVLYIYGQFIFGKSFFIYKDIGSDTYYQYYPYLVNCVLKLKSCKFDIWNWDYGLGTSILNVIGWTLDPFEVMVVLCGILFGIASMTYALIWMQILKIIISYLLCRAFLRYHTKNEVSVCLGAYLYAFNGYLMLWGQHYFLGTACIFLMLILIAIEKFLQTRGNSGKKSLAITIAFSLIYCYYTTYMLLIVVAIYFLIRFFESQLVWNFKDTVVEWGKCLFSVIAGICLSGVVLVPVGYYTLTNSSRMQGGSSSIIERMFNAIASSFSLSDFGTRVSRLLSNNMLFIEDISKSYFPNYYETPQLCLSIFIFFFIGEWIVGELNNAKGKRDNIIIGMKLFFLYILIFNSVSGFILNGFVYASYRYTFTIFPFLAIIVAKAWNNIEMNHISIKGILIGTIFSIIAVGYSLFVASSEVRQYDILVMLFLLFGLAILLALRFRCGDRKLLIVAFLLLIVSTATLENYITNNRVVVTKDEYKCILGSEGTVEKTQKAIAWINSNDRTLYRIDKTYEDWSVLSDSLLEQYSTTTWYNSTPNSNLSLFYERIYTDASSSYALKFFDMGSDRSLQALNLINLKYILSKDMISYPGIEKVYFEDGIYIYRNTNTNSVAKWFSKVCTKEKFESLSEKQQVEILKDTAILDESIEVADGAQGEIGDFIKKDETIIYGRVSCDSTGVLMIAIPFQEGWSVYIDDKKAETYSVDYGFIGVTLQKGNHEVVIKYDIPMQREGIIVSILGLGMLLILFLSKKNTSNGIIS